VDRVLLGLVGQAQVEENVDEQQVGQWPPLSRRAVSGSSALRPERLP
jgi:hypothetical protein